MRHIHNVRALRRALANGQREFKVHLRGGVFSRKRIKLCADEALEKFSAVDERKAELVKLRYFVGLNFEEAAAALGIAVPTAKQWWAYARTWLTVEMRG
jgi:hypothetical protein